MARVDQLLGGFPHRFLFDVGERHGCTRLRKRHCGRQPHARTGPGHERNLVVEVGVVVCGLMSYWVFGSLRRSAPLGRRSDVLGAEVAFGMHDGGAHGGPLLL